MDLSLTGKHALVCGSSQGIGRATAKELSLLGASVTLVARDEKRLKASIVMLDSSQGQTHDFIIADFSAPDKLKTIVSDYIANKKSFHILVNNTGGPVAGTALDSSLADYAKAFTAHLLSAQVITGLLVPYMKQEGFGRIINITSISAKQPILELGISNTIRAAVCNWGKSLSNELGEFGITVNNVLPGYTDTDRLQEVIDNKANIAGIPPDQMKRKLERQVPANRVAKPEEIGSAVAFLASPAASYINGINLPVDGGRINCL